MKRIRGPLLLAATLLAAGFVFLLVLRTSPAPKVGSEQKINRPPAAIDPLRVVLTSLAGEGAIEKEIRSLQAKIETSTDRNALLERLGWAFVAKARWSSDPGFYNLAEQAVHAITISSPDDPGAALLLGHIRDAQHRFAEAEAIARGLTARREFVFDHALLGDALMEQGKLEEAVGAYQTMVDLRPCLQTYSRVAHMRWLKGDLPGAIAAGLLAVSAGSPREPEPTAWAYAHLASYYLQASQMEEARRSSALALDFAPDYAPALLMRGRLFLAENKPAEAIAPLQRAVEISPLPENLWTLAEALRAGGDVAAAGKIEAQLLATGAAEDPRTLSLFLASSGGDAAQALRLASSELEARQDIFTHDAIAWAQLRNGEVEKARGSIRLALAEGTQDGRLFYHAGSIAAAAGANAEALELFRKANAFKQMLLPSERQALDQNASALIGTAAQISSK